MNDSVGARLRQARELRRLSLQQVSESTKLRTHYLQALENDDYTLIPSAAQARGFLRLYAEFLELDLAALVPSAQSAPVPAASAAPVEPEVARPSLWAGLRARLARRPAAEPASPASEPPPAVVAEAAPEASQVAAESPLAVAEPAPSLPAPAATDITTTRTPKKKAGN